MKLELYKPYLTQGGHKAVVVGYYEENNEFEVWHAESNSAWLHNADGTTIGYSPPLHIIAEWQEPKPHAPELTVEWFRKAALYKGDKLIKSAIVDIEAALEAAHIIKCVKAWDDAEALEARLIELRG